MLYGYAGAYLRIDLETGRAQRVELNGDLARDGVGGSGLGARLLYAEVPPGTAWDDPGNRMYFFTGPLAGTRVSGTGTFSVVTKGAMTGLATTTQANGFLGAFLKTCGADGLVLEGQARDWVYVLVKPDGVELRDASHLLGLDTWELGDAISAELAPTRCSVFGIGPAGEHLVRFAGIVGDRGHIAAHNGVGAVLGAKRVKAIAVVRGDRAVPVASPARLDALAPRLFAHAKAHNNGMRHQWGTAGNVTHLYAIGQLPIKNLTTSVWLDADKVTGQVLREVFKHKPKACWACTLHCRTIEVTEGEYAGFVGEEPEYEGVASTSHNILNPDPGASVYLSNLCDRLGIDINETGWVLGWVMESYEKGYLTREQLGGLDMSWGNAKAAGEFLRQLAHRQGAGALLSDGVKAAAERLGGEARNCAVYTLKGASPRSHDHRARWDELLDTCLANTGTIETTGGHTNYEELGVEPPADRFDALEVARANAQINGRRVFEDSLGLCRFTAEDFTLLVEVVNAVTGWELTVRSAMDAGLRAVNRLRAFNLRHGLDPALEAPSARYGSAPVDGPVAGITIEPVFAAARAAYWRHMGWDERDGRPLPETLGRLGLGELAPDLWG